MHAAPAVQCLCEGVVTIALHVVPVGVQEWHPLGFSVHPRWSNYGCVGLRVHRQATKRRSSNRSNSNDFGWRSPARQAEEAGMGRIGAVVFLEMMKPGEDDSSSLGFSQA